MNRKEILTAARHNLKETTASIWTDAYLYAMMNQSLRDISDRAPLRKSAIVPFVEYTTDLDVSGLSYFDIRDVEFPVCSTQTPTIRSHSLNGDYLALDLDRIPKITHRTTSGTDASTGTLTGTVTFTNGSRAVTGVGTLFTTELKNNYEHTNGDLICPSANSRYYQVAYCSSATALVLTEVFEEATVADTLDSTLSRTHDSCARVHHSKLYTLTVSPVSFQGYGLNDITVGYDYTGTTTLNYVVKITTAAATDKYDWSDDGGVTWDATAVNCSTTAAQLNNGVTVVWAASTGHTLNEYWTFTVKPSDLPPKYEEVVISGTVAHAAQEYLANYIQTKLTGVTTLLSTASTSAGNLAARITQAIADLASLRNNIGTNLGSLGMALESAETDLAAVVTTLTTGIGTIPTISAGVATAMTDIETALDQLVTDLGSARTNMSTLTAGGKVTEKYTEIAKTDAEEAKQRIAKARQYLDELKETLALTLTYPEYAKAKTGNTKERLDKARIYLESLKTQHEYVELGIQELAAGGAYLNQSQEYMRQAEQSINSTQLASSYRTWANQKWAEYQDKLQRITKVTSKGYRNPRSL
uniref:Putative structural protein n=1 Tax=viral metagenome TaxID=1070528 RepID=A0A6M3IPU7_9ZZZZ